MVVTNIVGNVQASSNNNNHIQLVPASSPSVSAAVSAAAATALGTNGNNQNTLSSNSNSHNSGHSVHNTITTGVKQLEVKTTTGPQLIKTTLVISHHSSTTTTPIVSLHKLHKHSNKKINITDKLHKFDLYIDPVCEQLNKLTEKQLNKVQVQLKHFSQLVSNLFSRMRIVSEQ